MDIPPDAVEANGTLGIKVFWWRGVTGRLTVVGQRLDAPAPPLRVRIPEGYGDSGFQSTGYYFPTEGCWEVTGSVGSDELTIVTVVAKE